ncbi:MAG: CarD family transcriptional regulator [Desulfitobacterium sp.]
MFKINDYVVYGSSGSCEIVDIVREKDISDNDTEYYVLQPAYHNNITIKTPVNNPKVLMRPIMTREDVLSLIATMPELEPILASDDRHKNESYKAALKTGQSEEWVKVIKALYIEQQERLEAGKKLAKADDDIMKAAEKNLHEEFALALNISPDEVLPYILEHVQ